MCYKSMFMFPGFEFSQMLICNMALPGTSNMILSLRCSIFQFPQGKWTNNISSLQKHIQDNSYYILDRSHMLHGHQKKKKKSGFKSVRSGYVTKGLGCPPYFQKGEQSPSKAAVSTSPGSGPSRVSFLNGKPEAEGVSTLLAGDAAGPLGFLANSIRR